MWKFFYKVFLFLLPVIFLLGVFVLADPFRLIYAYNDYSATYTPTLNRDFVSGQTYIAKRNIYHYNSFVFGSSRTLAYSLQQWKTYLGKDAVPFKFDASLENIFGIYSKINYIDAQGDSLKNVLLIVCTNLTFSTDEDSEGILFMKHPEISKTSKIRFYKQFIKAYFHRNYLVNFFMHFFTGNYYHHDYRDVHGAKLDTITNEMVMQLWNRELEANPDLYYQKRKSYFFQRDSTQKNYATRDITAKQLVMLKKIKQIFDKHKTNYKIIISPIYEQCYFNREDKRFLEAIFGKHTIYDYSGINQYTVRKENYYEECHYLPKVGKAIMEEIYK